ncbi:hypothetical protein C8J55DRAFT_609718 [Lentinula edodes]|uniref:Uncharacterized protein n=1 Tax=Lentinula lateritia TaxID=40482 RepID=A0A9W8ZRV4_9AGAR|nr:hypothetical protein C8J55DRAFT_609718 [Lentinula edodes]
MYYYSPVYQMLIPPKYLVTTSNAPTAAITQEGDNMLGLKVWCMQPGCMGRTPVAEWSTWRIPQSPTDNPNWIHPHQMASPEPKCDQSPPKPVWVAGIFEYLSHNTVTKTDAVCETLSNPGRDLKGLDINRFDRNEILTLVLTSNQLATVRYEDNLMNLGALPVEPVLHANHLLPANPQCLQ